MSTTPNPASMGYSQVTRDIRVSAIPSPLLDESDPAKNVYAFSYTITLENLGTTTAQLMERHWIIFSGEKQSAEVVGPGVVGKQPNLEKGQKFTYTSGAVINDPYGAMHGSYTFRSADGSFFEVAIPRFDLLYPVIIH